MSKNDIDNNCPYLEKMKTTYKNQINISYDGDRFFMGKHLTVEEAQKEWKKYDGADTDLKVKRVEHIYYRTGFLPVDVRVDDENCSGWWIINKPELMAGKCTELIMEKIDRN